MDQKRKRARFGVFTILIFAISLTACKPAVPAEPTLDANAIFTQSAQTMIAQLTRTALSLPTATNTEQPTPTLTPTQEPTFTPETQTTSTTPVSSPVVGSTPNPNKMVFVADITIPDGQVIPPGTKFVKTWRLKNTGTTTWKENYKVRLWAGQSFGAPTSFLLGQEVKPNAEVDISIEFTAPTQQGEYSSYWILSDEIEANFGTVFNVTFVIGTLATSTATTTPEPEPTATP